MTYDDGYDDEYDELEDEFEAPRPDRYAANDSETLLRRVIDIIATAPTFPLSSTPRIDRDEIIQLLEEALDRLPEEIAILIIEHDMDVALALADSITVMYHGRVICEGDRAQVVADPRVREIYLAG